MTVPALTFLAPPSIDAGPDEELHDVTAEPPPGRSRRDQAGPRDRSDAAADDPGALRMTRGAREAAAGMGVSDADVQRCLDEPTDVSPDADNPARTRFRRGDLTVTAAADGMVLHVARRGR